MYIVVCHYANENISDMGTTFVSPYTFLHEKDAIASAEDWQNEAENYPGRVVVPIDECEAMDFFECDNVVYVCGVRDANDAKEFHDIYYVVQLEDPH